MRPRYFNLFVQYTHFQRPMPEQLRVSVPVEQAGPGVPVEHVDLDHLNRVGSDDKIDDAMRQVYFLQLGLQFVEAVQTGSSHFLFLLAQACEVAPLVVLGDGRDRVVVVECPEFLGPLAVVPLPHPDLDEWLIFLVWAGLAVLDLLEDPLLQVGEVVDVSNYALALAENPEEIGARPDHELLLGISEEKLVQNVVQPICLRV